VVLPALVSGADLVDRAAVDVDRCDLAYVLDLLGEPSEVAAK